MEGLEQMSCYSSTISGYTTNNFYSLRRFNRVIDWEGAKVVDKEMNRCARWIKEAIWIRKTKPTMNRDERGLQTKSRVGQSARHAI